MPREAPQFGAGASPLAFFPSCRYVDGADAICFVDCLAGPGGVPAPTLPNLTPEECLGTFDFNRDADVDVIDYARLQRIRTVP